MGCVYAVMCCKKFTKQGAVSCDCYKNIEDAQAFCQSRYNVKKVNEMYYSSNDYDYYITILNVK